MGNSCSLAVAGGVFDDVFLCCPFFPLDVLDEIWDVIESVSEGFLTYSCLLGAKRFFFNFRKIFPTKEMHSIALILHVKKTGNKDQSVSVSF